MMKKAISFSFIILIFLLVYQIGINYIKDEHSVTYSIKTKDNTYLIEEDYSKKDKDSYLIRITDKNNNKFVFDVKNKFNKQREIVKDIITYNSDDGLYCIALALLSNLEFIEPQCSINNITYSYSYIMKKHNITSFLDQIKDFDYKKYSGQSSVREDNGIKINKDYLEDREKIVLYDYKRVVVHTNINSEYFNFSTSDNYKNTVGTTVGKFYIIPKLTENATINTFFKYNLEYDIKGEITAPKISKQYYINGVHDDKLYIFDKSDKKQYVIDPKEDTITDITNNEQGIIYEEGKEKKVSVYELAEKEIVFTDDASAYKSIDYDKIYVGDDYAVYLKSGNYYKVYEKYPDSPILLFEANGIKEIKIRDNNIYYIKDDSLYRHNNYGDVVLLSKNEIKFNSYNIYDIYFME